MDLHAWADAYVKRYPGRAARSWGELTDCGCSDPCERCGRGYALADALKNNHRCCECGRALTDEESMRMGIGPECMANLEAEVDALLAGGA